MLYVCVCGRRRARVREGRVGRLNRHRAPQEKNKKDTQHKRTDPVDAGLRAAGAGAVGVARAGAGPRRAVEEAGAAAAPVVWKWCFVRWRG
jgi:hypothetical protein